MSVATEAAPTDRTGIRTGQYFQIVRQRLELLNAAKEGARAVLCAGRKFGSTKIAHHERMTGEYEPRLIGTRVVGDEQRDMFGCVSRSMQDLDGDVSKFQHVAVTHSPERKGRVRLREKHILGSGFFGQRAAGRKMVSMKVRVDDVTNAHAGRLSGTKIRRNVTERINDRCRSLPAASEQIGGRYRIDV